MDTAKIIENFKKHGFAAQYFATAAEAADYLCSRIQNTTVGIGGSMTVKQMNLADRLAPNNQVFWHWLKPGPETLAAAATTAVYITSANGVAATGELVNIDGHCNRIASTLYGHDTVYFICGINKVAPDLEAAIHRARNIAAPLNARRLERKTPCAHGDLMCHDCSSADRICKGLAIHLKKTDGARQMELLLIGEALGY